MRLCRRRGNRLGEIILSEFANFRVRVARRTRGEFSHQCVIKPGIELQEQPVIRFLFLLQNRIDFLFDVRHHPIAGQRLDDVPGDLERRMSASSKMYPFGKQELLLFGTERWHGTQGQVAFPTSQRPAQNLNLVHRACEFRKGLRKLAMGIDDSLPKSRGWRQCCGHFFFPAYCQGSISINSTK
jgi:hypothetical protein